MSGAEKQTPKTPKTPKPPKTVLPEAQTVAAIDIGSNSLRMVIAEVRGNGRIDVIERLQQTVHLGQDTFRRGRLTGRTMRAAIGVLRDYAKLLDLYNVERTRAVATTAVREAGNSDTFLDRVYMATGLSVEVIDTSEESRLTVSAVQQAVGGALGLRRMDVLIADVGGGSTLLTVLHKGEIAASQSFPLGSIRLQEVLSTGRELPDVSAELLRQQIANVVSTAEGLLPLGSIKGFVAVGGDARFAAKEVGKATSSSNLHTVSRPQLDKLVRKCHRHSADELARRYGLSFAEAETLNPALLVYQELMHVTRARRMIVPHVSMRDGLVMDLARTVTGQEDQALIKGVTQSATAIAEKYRVNLPHARAVARLSVKLFDELREEHGLSGRHRLLLRVAGLVHEVGGYVSARAHHKHSYYLVLNSEIFGLTRAEIVLVAHITRYHRRGCPKPSHVDYVSLPRESRVVISKLASLLRVADALDRSHAQQIRDFRCERQGEDLILSVPGVSDLTLERKAIAAKADLFEDVYGLRVRLEEAQLSAPAGA